MDLKRDMNFEIMIDNKILLRINISHYKVNTKYPRIEKKYMY